jgi:hypothetical protein
MQRACWFWVAGAFGCGDDEERTYINSGDVCMTPVDGQLRTTVTLSECLPAACNRIVTAACTLVAVENSLVLSSRIIMEPTRPTTDPSCGADCGSWSGTCSIPEPLSGDYTLVFGSIRGILSFPLAGPTTFAPDGGLDSCSVQ